METYKKILFLRKWIYRTELRFFAMALGAGLSMRLAQELWSTNLSPVRSSLATAILFMAMVPAYFAGRLRLRHRYKSFAFLCIIVGGMFFATASMLMPAYSTISFGRLALNLSVMVAMMAFFYFAIASIGHFARFQKIHRRLLDKAEVVLEREKLILKGGGAYVENHRK